MTDVVLYLVVVSLLAALGAQMVDGGLRRMALPSRWAWAVSLTAGPLLLLADTAGGIATGAPGLGAPIFYMSPLVIGLPTARTPGIDLAVTTVWLLSSLVMLLVLVRSWHGLTRERRAWSRRRVLGRDVLVAPERGPAVAGALRPSIVLPRWALGMPESDLRMVLLHEEEHVRAHDAALVSLALAIVTLTPWNPVSWWQLRRFRLAIEMDCDRRVLERDADRTGYGRSLLAVAGRAVPGGIGFAGFTEGSSLLERRIVAMTKKRTGGRVLLGMLLTGGGLLVGAQACGLEGPDDILGPNAASLDADATEEQADGLEPGPTPYTVAPAILNRSEVVEAMEAEYPPELRDLGIGGTVRVYVLVDSEGAVSDYRIDESSGNQRLDDAALRVMRTFRFRPALDGDEPIDVWISFPITFQVS